MRFRAVDLNHVAMPFAYESIRDVESRVHERGFEPLRLPGGF